MDAAFERYRFARDQKIGRKIPCAYCGEKFSKKTQTHAFCSNSGRNNCKDLFWQLTDEDGIRMRDVAKNANNKKAEAVPEENERMTYIKGMLPYASRAETIQIAKLLGYEDGSRS